MAVLPREKFHNSWENIQASLWFLPSAFVLLAMLLSWTIPRLHPYLIDHLTASRPIAFSGSSDAARTVLSVIAGSTITVISLLFSITIVALQQASTQFTPRIMRNFMRDRGNQVVLGVYLATFLYSLLVLGQIRGDASGRDMEVPGLAITTSIALAVACLGMLVYFIHHGATLFQASNIVEIIHRELRDRIDQFYPSTIGDPAMDEADDLERIRRQVAGEPTIEVRAASSGYLRSIDDDALIDGVGDATWGIVHPFIGTYITQGDLLAEVERGDTPEDEVIAAIRNAFVQDRERTMYQDALFGIRQLVDIAVKALSPAINDPTTAEHALSCIGDTVASIVNRPFPRRLRTVERADQAPLRLWMNRPSFDDVVNISFTQIRRTGRDEVHVMLHLLKVLESSGSRARGERAGAFHRQIDDIAWYVEEGGFAPHERENLRQCIESTRRAISSNVALAVPATSDSL